MAIAALPRVLTQTPFRYASAVINALAPEVPRCDVEHVHLGDEQNCSAMAGLLSPQLVIVEALSRHAAAARLALSLGCASYWRVRVPARVMPVELRDEPASGESGQQARRSFAHACALVHVASAFRDEALPVAVMQDDAPAPAPGQLPAVVRRLASVLQNVSDITPLGGDSLETSMHAYAVSAGAAERVARLLAGFEVQDTVAAEAFNTQLLNAPFHALLEPLTSSGRLVIRDAAAGEPPFAMQQPGVSTGADELVVACVGFDAVAQACEQHWLVPMLLHNATGMRVRLVSEGEVAKAHVVLLLYSYGRADALARARQLSRSTSLVIAQTLRPSGCFDVLTAAGSSASVPLLPRWLQASLILRHHGGALDHVELHPALFAQQHAAWLHRPAVAARLWVQGDAPAHEATLSLFSAAGLALDVLGPVPRQLVAPPLPQKAKPRVVVTLTSIPPRMHFLPAVIASLLNQTHAPDAIYVTLPRVWARGDSAQMAPVARMARQLARLDRRIVVKRPDVDLGPAMKLLPALEAEDARAAGGDALILYLDDDWVLPPAFVASFVAAAARAPGSIIYRSCGANLYEAAYSHRLGCSLPEAFQGVLLPLAALRAAFRAGGAATGVHGVVSRAAAHPACLRSDDFVFGHLYIRVGMRSAAMPADLEAGVGRMTPAASSSDESDSGVALNGGTEAVLISRYTPCAQHLRALLDALMPTPTAPAARPVLPLASPLADAFVAYRFAAVRDVEQAVLALTAGAVPVLLDCAARDTLDARVLAPSRVICATGRSAGFSLRRLALNATAQRAFFARPATVPGARDAVQGLLGDAARVLRERAQQLCASDQPPGFAAVCASLAALPDADKY